MFTRYVTDELERSEEKLILKEVPAEIYDNHEENINEAMYRKLTTQKILRILDNMNFEKYKNTVSEVIPILKIYYYLQTYVS